MLVVQNIFIYVAALVFSIDSDRSLFKKSIRTMESLLAHDIKHRGNMDKLKMAVTSVKLEPGVKQEPDDYEKRFMQLLIDYPDGVSQQFVQSNLVGIQGKQILRVINELEKKNRLETLQSQSGKLVWRLRSKEAADTMSTMDAVERTVFKVIVGAKDQGVTVAQVRTQTKVTQKEVQRILKTLEERKAIKSIKAPTGRNKIYLAFGITPNSSLTTQSPFMDGDGIDQDFVDIISQECIHYLERRSDLAKNKTEGPLVRRNACYASAEDIQEHILGLKICKIKLSVGDVEKLLNALVLEGRLECTMGVLAKEEPNEQMDVDLDGGSGSNLRYRIAPQPAASGLMKVPCGVCPVRTDCRVGGIISPETCVYMKEWLTF